MAGMLPICTEKEFDEGKVSRGDTAQVNEVEDDTEENTVQG